MAPPSYLYLMVALNISVSPGDIKLLPSGVTSAPQVILRRGTICAGILGSPLISYRSHSYDSEVGLS